MPRTAGVLWGTNDSGGSARPGATRDQAERISVSCWWENTLYALSVPTRVGWWVPCCAVAPLPEEPVLASTMIRFGAGSAQSAGALPSRIAVAKQPGQ